MPVTIGTTYVCIYKLIPDYLVPKKYLQFGLYGLYTFIISVFGILFSIFFGLAFLTNFQFSPTEVIGRNTLFIMACIYLVVIIVSAFKLLKLNLEQSKQNAELKSKILEAQLKLKEQELNYLKMQIHPHFLFNTLNTIYGYALKKNENAPDMILKLSNLLDYVLYQIDKPLVSLAEEINYIKDYISLEHIRFSDKLDITLRDNLEQQPIEIAPMLFLPFVENSFKHGNIINDKLIIDIEFNCSEDTVEFMIKNSNKPNDTKRTGIGLENIKKRLEHLYKNRYQLDIKEEGNMFIVNLIIQYKTKDVQNN